MKTFHPGEVEILRAEVRSLRAQINRLEARLSDYEGDDNHEMRALWPYNWILSGVETLKNALESRRKTDPKRFEPLEAEARFSRMMM